MGGLDSGRGTGEGNRKLASMEDRRPSLPEELVEKIASMMPFPSILKVRVLSKGWAAKFIRVSDNSLFLKQVDERSNSWEAYCPAFLLRDSFDVIGYNRTTNSWRKMHSLAYLPGDFVRQDITSEGSLVCGSVIQEWNVREQSLYVSNVLTRAYRVLPLPPNMTSVACKHLLQQGSDGYTVVVFSLDPSCRQSDPCTFDAHVYNSKIHAWRTTKVTIENDFYMNAQCSAYQNETLYVVSRHGLGVLTSGQIGILALNVEDLSWKMYDLSFPTLSRPCTSVTLVRCGGRILVVLSLDVEPRRTWLNLWDKSFRQRTTFSSSQQSLLVMNLNLDTRQLTVLTRGPPEALNAGLLHNNPLTDGTLIYFGAKTSDSVVAYDVEKDEWSSIPSLCQTSGINRGFQWSAFSFRPGLNSFLAV